MAIDEVPGQENVPTPAYDNPTPKIVAIAVVVAVLVIGQIYSLVRISSLRGALEAQQAAIERALMTRFEQELSAKMSALQSSNAEQLQAVQEELDSAAKRVGSTGRELRRARDMVAKLQTEQQQQAESLRGELAAKADQEQVGVLSENVTSTRTDLDTTKKTLEEAISQLGMTRTEFGTLIARNHDEIEKLRQLGDRDYFEFVLDKNQPQRIAGVGLELKKTNVKRSRYKLNLTADDMVIEKKNRTTNEPIFFYLAGSRRPYELVVNKVESKRVTGYVSTPKGVGQLAVRTEGAQ